MRGVRVADEAAVRPVTAGREGEDRIAQAHEVLRLAGKGHAAALHLAIIERADADGVAGGDEAVSLRVVNDQRELRVQRAEHLQAVFMVEGQQNFAVGLADEWILLLQPLTQGTEAVQFPVADHIIAAEAKGLHAALVQPHDGKALKAQIAAGDLHKAAHVRPARGRARKARLQGFRGHRLSQHAQNGTHKRHLRFSRRFVFVFQDEGRSPWCHPICFSAGPNRPRRL